MRVPAAIFAASFTLLAFGCGGEGTATVSSEGAPAPEAPAASEPRDFDFPTVSRREDPRFATVSAGKGRAEPAIDPADRPPPKRLLVRDIVVGSGPAARPGDRVAVFYIGVDQRTGAQRFHTWPPSAQPFVVRLRPPGSAEAWEEGLMGMRAGGRREMLVPSRLAAGGGALDYVFDLVRVEPSAGAR
jgi:FKBP-type peptidyl-prolyl cis-trans isomerase